MQGMQPLVGVKFRTAENGSGSKDDKLFTRVICGVWLIHLLSLRADARSLHQLAFKRACYYRRRTDSPAADGFRFSFFGCIDDCRSIFSINWQGENKRWSLTLSGILLVKVPVLLLSSRTVLINRGLGI